jgi:hypothetical protein
MAGSNDTVSSWPGFVDQLNRTFLLVRDVFGYTLPGGVFFAVGLISGKVPLGKVSGLFAPYHPPGWAIFILAVGACYIMGHILITVAYLPTDLLKLFYLKNTEKLRRIPTEVTWEMLTIRADHPTFFIDLDRRETMAMLVGGTSLALLMGQLCFAAPGLFPAKCLCSWGASASRFHDLHAPPAESARCHY